MLAIVIPYYKISFFKETLDSLVDQTNKNFKVYIGDDASFEDPRPLLKNYYGLLDLTYNRFEVNVGALSLVQQWGRCIQMTRDEKWIMILGDDDILDNQVVSSFYEQFPHFNGKTKLVRFSSFIIDGAGNKISPLFEQPQWEKASTAFYRRFKGETRSTLSEYVFQKKSYQSYGFRNFPLAWHSDDCAWLEFAEDQPIYGINQAAVLVRLSEHNISGKKDNLEQKWLAKRAFYKYIVKFRLPLFNQEQRKFLLEAFENTISEKRKLNLKEWALLIRQYLSYTDIKIQKKFYKRKVKMVLKR